MTLAFVCVVGEQGNNTMQHVDLTGNAISDGAAVRAVETFLSVRREGGPSAPAPAPTTVHIIRRLRGVSRSVELIVGVCVQIACGCGECGLGVIAPE